MSFGKNLQYLRQLSNNMTQEALAEKMNVSRQTISKWEMDIANPKLEKAFEHCKIFNQRIKLKKWMSPIMLRETSISFKVLIKYQINWCFLFGIII